jgi:ABC-type sugar transport system permease subunit
MASVTTTGAPAASTGGRPPGRARRGLSAGQGRAAAVLIAPTLIMLAVVIGYPVVGAIVQSLKGDQSLVGGFFTKGGSFVGADNYTKWLLQQCGNGTSCPPGTLPSQFWDAVFVTVFFAVVTVVIEVILGMGMAMIMNKDFRGRSLLRACVLIPWAIPTAVTAKLWFFMFATAGVVNNVLGTHTLWTSGEWSSRIAVITGDVWKTTPFVALLVLAGLQVIDREMYEAGKIDGASAWQRFRYITLPLARPAIMVAVLFRILDVLRIYDLPAILTNGGGGSGHATTTLSILVVEQLRQGYGAASALSTITFVFIFLVAFAFIKLFNTSVVRTQQKEVK